jgi:hypothetical protein
MNDNSKCCGPRDPLEQIQSLYTELALQPDKDFGWGKGKDNARKLGYADESFGNQQQPSVTLSQSAPSFQAKQWLI